MVKKIVTFFFISLFAIVCQADTPNNNQDNFASRPDVKLFVNEMVKKHHFKAAELYALFSQVKIRPKIIEISRAPLEQKPWYTYRLLYVTNERIQQGVLFWNQFEDVLAATEKKYGVPAAIIVATIGVESRYGKNTGEYPVIDALVNLSFEDKRRSDFFKQELESFLLLALEQKLDPRTITGSYAGAIGQPQFMPSSFRHYAVSYTKKDKIDLTHHEPDVIASIANYYQKNGWVTNELITLPLNLGRDQYPFLSSTKLKPITLSELILNNRMMDKQHSLTAGNLILLRGDYGNEYWMGYHNFDVIKRYNHSNLYAMAVYQLSYYISALREATKRA